MTDMEFEDHLYRFFSNKRDAMREQYHRVLPAGELLFNRYDKAKYLGCGEGTSIYDTAVIMGDVSIGSHTWIGPYTLLEGINAKLEIGDYVSVNTGVSIYTHDSTKHHVSGGVEPFVTGAVSIGDCTVIGTMSMISCNVKIGSHCVIGAHSFVNSDMPDYSIFAGTPAKKIGYVSIDESGKVTFNYI